MPSDKPSGTQETFGSATLAVPSGWTEVKRSAEQLTFRMAAATTVAERLRRFAGLSKSGGEQATITKLELATKPSFQEFERLCNHRLDAERSQLKDGFVKGKPEDIAGTFILMYSGGDKASSRIFSGYCVAKTTTFFTVYLEAFGVEPRQHLASFSSFVSAFKVS